MVDYEKGERDETAPAHAGHSDRRKPRPQRAGATPGLWGGCGCPGSSQPAAGKVTKASWSWFVCVAQVVGNTQGVSRAPFHVPSAASPAGHTPSTRKGRCLAAGGRTPAWPHRHSCSPPRSQAARGVHGKRDGVLPGGRIGMGDALKS